MEPNDVDCVLLAAETTADQSAEDELNKGLPFLEIALVQQFDFDYLVNRFFADDRKSNPKGMVELVP